MLAAEVTVAGLLASSGGGLSEGHARALLALFCVFAAGFAWSWVRTGTLIYSLGSLVAQMDQEGLSFPKSEASRPLGVWYKG